MPQPSDLLKIGLARREVVSRLGEPHRIEFIKASFRPPNHGEQTNDYRKALRKWEERTIGELCHYDDIALLVRISKAGQVVSWGKNQTTKTESTKPRLIAIEPERNKSCEKKE